MVSNLAEQVRVGVVGAGISGLVTAFLLRQQNIDVTVFEKEDRVGGSILSTNEGGYLVELGPNTVLNNNFAIDELIECAGMTGEKMVAGGKAKNRYIAKDGKLMALPSGPLGFLTTPIFPARAKFRLLKEPFIGRADREESIAQFVTRRLGPDLLKWAVGPFVSGVYAGDAETLSVRWATRKIYALEEKYGSLIRGAVARRKGPQPAGKLLTFRDGLDRLTKRLGEHLQDGLKCSCPVHEINRIGSRFDLQYGLAARKTESFSHVVVTGDSREAARILSPLTDTAPLRDLPYSGVVILGLGFPAGTVSHPLDGFGFLMPPHMNQVLLGCLFPSSIFAGRAPENHALLTAFLGGARRMDVLDWNEEKILDETLGLLRPLLGITGDPSFAVSRSWPRAIPQYVVGHGRVIEWAENLERKYPGLYVGGNLLSGVSVADCISNASRLAARLIEETAPASF